MGDSCERCWATVHEVRMTCGAPERFRDKYTLTCEFCDEALWREEDLMEEKARLMMASASEPIT